MNTKIRSFAFCLTGCLLACVTGHAYEQDNWYLHGPIDGNLTGVFHQEYNATAKKDMLYRNVTGVGLEVRDINGTLLQTIDTGGITFTDIEYDQNTSRLFGINASKLTCYEQNSSGGWSEQWRSNQGVTTMAQGPSGKLFCANNGNKIYVFEQNGTMSSEFGYVDGINSLGSKTNIVGFAPGGILVLWGEFHVNGGTKTYRYFSFEPDGSYIKSWNYSHLENTGSFYSRMHNSGLIFIKSRRYSNWSWENSKFYNPVGNTPSYPGIEVSLWLQNGDFISGSNLYRRTFRTKMETNHNSVPEPVIHRIAQRTGTNILELDFEVIDTDDDNVTVGILAYCGSDKLVPQTWLNGTGSKIGTPIATNTVHSMEWDVKQDWPDSTGSIKFEILCQDGSRDKPVDLHFLKLPFEDRNMTISRSPLNDDDFLNYAKFLLATGQAQFESNTSFDVIAPFESNDSNPTYIFTTCGATGREGPTEAQIINEYNGTNLHGMVAQGWKPGYQKWTVPTTGTYTVEVIGARGGTQPQRQGKTYISSGAYMRGEFNLTAGQELTIVVGQHGEDNPTYGGGSGGGGASFVVADTNNTPLIIAGGGSGHGGHGQGSRALTSNDGANGYYGELRGTNGNGAPNNNGGGGGFYTSANGTWGGAGFQQGLLGGNGNTKGGFGGGGGGSSGAADTSGGGGGYSGGGGAYAYNGGGGGSYNSSDNQINLTHMGFSDGSVRITFGNFQEANVQGLQILEIQSDMSWKVNALCRAKLLYSLGDGYKFATSAERNKAREAATPGGVNNWTATNQVKPRNLPGKVNEYGFDVSTTSGYWVIKE